MRCGACRRRAHLIAAQNSSNPRVPSLVVSNIWKMSSSSFAGRMEKYSRNVPSTFSVFGVRTNGDASRGGLSVEPGRVHTVPSFEKPEPPLVGTTGASHSGGSELGFRYVRPMPTRSKRHVFSSDGIWMQLKNSETEMRSSPSGLNMPKRASMSSACRSMLSCFIPSANSPIER